MDYQRVKANLNLHAVLRNLETLVACDGHAADIIKEWQVTLQFSVFRGPTLFLTFENGQCKAGKGPIRHRMFASFLFPPAISTA